MQAYVITIDGNYTSEKAANELTRSSQSVGNDFDIIPFHAVRPDNAEKNLSDAGLKWTYPWSRPKVDIASGLTLTPYVTADKGKRISCFLSHYYLWKKCAEGNENVLVLEHDALFTKKIDSSVTSNNYGIIGINDPRGATRKSIIYSNMIQESRYPVQPVPRIDNPMVPQGLAGNSAYIIKPWAAKQVLETLSRLGAWPNDALLCYQNFRMNFLGVTKQYYTRVQGTPSTTTL